MASDAAPLFDAATHAQRWVADYGRTAAGDVMASSDDPAWIAMFEELATVAGEDLGHARERVQRHAVDIGTGFRIIGEADERPWPVSPVPLLIEAREWAGIERGVIQRAGLMETLIADLYGEGQFVERGLIPAALVTGSPYFLRPLVGLEPPGGHHLHFIAMDLGRGPTGEWRVLSDHLRAAAGAGYALENRLAVSRTLGELQARLNVARHAPFFAAFRDGIAAMCKRTDPRLGLLTPGRFNPSYPEQAHLARYLGLLLVEGADLAALEDTLYVRTIGGLKRLDALWRRVDPRLLDPLAFDSHSQIGVGGLIDAYAAGNVVLSNAPGAGVLESPAFGAFLPQLAVRLLGEELLLPNIATWWCGQPRERALVEEELDRLLIGPAFGPAPIGAARGRDRRGRGPRPRPARGPARGPGAPPAGLCRAGDRAAFHDAGRRRRRAGTTPVHGARLCRARRQRRLGGAARRVRADRRAFRRARQRDGARRVVRGRLRPRRRSRVIDLAAARVELAPYPAQSGHAPQPRRGQFLLARPLPRTRRSAARGDPRHARPFDRRRCDARQRYARQASRARHRIGCCAASPQPAPAGTSISSRAPRWRTRAGIRSRRSTAWRARSAMDRAIGCPRIWCGCWKHPFRRIAGCWIAQARSSGAMPRSWGSAPNIWAARRRGASSTSGAGSTPGAAITRALRLFGMPGGNADDLSTLLDLANSQISYRQRYPTGIARVPVVDLVALDPGNPRSLAYQAERASRLLADLPVLDDDGMAEPQQSHAISLAALLATASAASLDADALGEIERRLGQISDALAHRYFLQGAEPLRAGGLTLA